MLKVRVVVLLGVVALGCGLLSNSAGASIAGKTTMKLSGAVSGTLTEGTSGICTIGRSNGVVVIGLMGHISGAGKKYSNWSLDLSTTSGKSGTYTVNSTSGASGQLGAAKKGAQMVGLQLNLDSGKFTLDGTKGSMSVVFGTGSKAIKAKGSWNCKA